MIYVYIELLLIMPLLILLALKDKKDNKLRIYGIYGFFGLPGKGKTVAMTKYLQDMRRKYGNDIYIMTNYYYNDQDYVFTSWKDLLKKYDKPLIVAWDEIQNEFNSRDFKNFPIALMSLLTQVRKDNGVQILYTAQRWHFVDKNFRSLTFGAYECNTLLGRYTVTKLYDPVDYDNLCGQSDYDKRRKIRPIKVSSFVQTDKVRNAYDSYKMLDSAKEKEYMDRDEINRIERLV